MCLSASSMQGQDVLTLEETAFYSRFLFWAHHQIQGNERISEWRHSVVAWIVRHSEILVWILPFISCVTLASLLTSLIFVAICKGLA